MMTMMILLTVTTLNVQTFFHFWIHSFRRFGGRNCIFQTFPSSHFTDLNRFLQWYYLSPKDRFLNSISLLQSSDRRFDDTSSMQWRYMKLYPLIWNTEILSSGRNLGRGCRKYQDPNRLVGFLIRFRWPRIITDPPLRLEVFVKGQMVQWIDWDWFREHAASLGYELHVKNKISTRYEWSCF